MKLAKDKLLLSLQVGLVVWSDVVHGAPLDDAHVNVAAGAQVVEDTSGNGIPHQQFSFVLLLSN
jgi:hypothetical protein